MEVLNAINKIKTNAMGLDEIPLRFIKLLLPLLIPYITYVFNKILSSSEYPTAWKDAKIIPVHKKSSTFQANDFRPISILPALSKALETIMKTQISSYLSENNLLCSVQSGFRRYHSTESALLNVTSDVRLNTDLKHISLLLLLDFSKAFDTVNHNLLCSKLKNNFKFSSSAIKLIKSYLCDRRQCVIMNQIISSFLPMPTGVPQGSVLGPLLFTIFINDLPDIISHCTSQLFADDVQIYCSGKQKELSQTVEKVNADLQSVAVWAESNGLMLNATKTQAIVINNKTDTHIPPILLNGTVIEISQTVKNLGVIFDNKLNFKKHAASIVSKIYSTLYRLRKLAPYTPFTIKKRLIKMLCIPHITYCTTVTSQLDALSLRKIELAYNACTRYIFGLRKFDHISPYRHKLLGCSIFQYIKFRWSFYLFRLLIYKQPRYLYDRISYGPSERSCNLKILRNSSSQLNASFFVRGVAQWNELPINIKKANSCREFKIKCLDYYSAH